jgi:Mrp family chromosome partitioning ATPase
LADLRKQMQAAQAEAKRIETWETQIVRLERNREMFDEQYRHASQRLESAKADSAKDAGTVTNIPLVQPPTLPDRPMTEGLKKLLALIFAGCAGCGLALAYVREYVLDHSIRHLAEVRGLLHAPLLATLPRVKGDRLNPGPCGNPKGRSLNTARELDSACEVIAQMVREQVKRETRTLLVGFTAPHTGAGVTTVAQHVAHAMQFSGIKDVLLTTIAADGRFTGKRLGETTRDTESEEVSPADGDGGDQSLMPAYQADPVKEPYSSSTAISPSVLEEFKRHEYDCVLFDLPPPSTSDVTVRLLPRLDGVVLVLETLATPRSQALACMRQFEQLRCEVYGAVLNKFRSHVPAWLMSPADTQSPRPTPVPAE